MFSQPEFHNRGRKLSNIDDRSKKKGQTITPMKVKTMFVQGRSPKIEKSDKGGEAKEKSKLVDRQMKHSCVYKYTGDKAAFKEARRTKDNNAILKVS